MVWNPLLVHLDNHFQNSDPSLCFDLLLGIEKIETIRHLYLESKVIRVLVLDCHLVAYFCEHTFESAGRSLAALLLYTGVLTNESEIFYVDGLDQIKGDVTPFIAIL